MIMRLLASNIYHLKSNKALVIPHLR